MAFERSEKRPPSPRHAPCPVARTIAHSTPTEPPESSMLGDMSLKERPNPNSGKRPVLLVSEEALKLVEAS